MQHMHMNECSHMFAHTHRQSHTWVAGPLDLIPSLAACAWFRPPLPSLLAVVAAAARLPAAAGDGTKAAFVVSLQLHYPRSCPATVYGTLGLTCPPVQMLMNWDIVLTSFSQFCMPCGMCSQWETKKQNINDYFLCPSFSCFFFVSWNWSSIV